MEPLWDLHKHISFIGKKVDVTKKNKPIHPGENDPSLPIEIRGIHFNSWQDLARALGYHE